MEEEKIKEITDKEQANQSEQDRTEKGKKISLWLMSIIVIFTLLAFGLGLFLGKEIFSKEDSNSEKNVKQTIQDKPLETFNLANFDPTKIINGNNMEIYGKVVELNSNLYLLKNSSDSQMVESKISEDGKNIDVTINWEKMKEVYFNINETSTKKYTITFDKKVRNVYINGWGQGWGNETIFYLMEDGTIEYTPLSVKLLNNLTVLDSFSLSSYGKIPNVEDVVLIVGADYNIKDSQYGGEIVILGIKANGEFYDLSKILDNTSAYEL